MYNIDMNTITYIMLVICGTLFIGCARGVGFTPPPASANQSGPMDGQTVLGTVPWIEDVDKDDVSYQKPNWWGK